MSDNLSVSTITNTMTNISSESNGSTIKSEKDNEKACELYVRNMLKYMTKINGNNKCADCDANDPDWLVTNLGIFVCIECCGIHREMGVQISKTQSIKIDRLNISQLIIARMIGNSKLNSIFEQTVQKFQKLNSSSTMDQRQRYLRAKYEHHIFVGHEYTNEILCKFIEGLEQDLDIYYSFDFLLKIFAQNIDLLQPVSRDSKNRNILQIILENFDEYDLLIIVDFIIQNRDFPKNIYKIDYQDVDGNTALHYCAIYNRVNCTKLLLKSNANYKIKNDAGLTALEIANNLKNIECAQQINLYLEGKPMDKINWMYLLDDDYDKTGSEANKKLEKALIDRPIAERPISMVSTSNKSLGCSKIKKIHNYNRQHSESFNSVNIESYLNQKKANRLSKLPEDNKRTPFEEKKLEQRSLENLKKEMFIDQNEPGKLISRKNNNRYTAIIDYVPVDLSHKRQDPIDFVGHSTYEPWINEEKFYSKL